VERYGRIRLWGSIGFIATVQGVGLLLDFTSLSLLPWICLGILGATFASCFWLSEAPAIPGPSIGGLVGGFGNPEMLALLAACFMMSAAHSPLYVFYSIHLVDHGYTKAAVGAFWGLGVVAEILIFLWMPRLMRLVALRTILAMSFAIAVLRFLLIGWAVDWLLAAIAAQVMHGATFGACHAAAVTTLNRWYSDRQQARAQALYSSASFGAGGLVGGLVSGYAWGAFGSGPTYTIAAIFAAAGLVVVLRGLRLQ
jgi:PPP family 3-phenylpropionic acid transporter